MLEGLFQGPEFLNSALDGLTARNDAIADNLANVDTPNYKAKRVDFESQLQGLLQRSKGADPVGLVVDQPRQFTLRPNSVGDIKPVEWTASGTSMRNDGNNVDIDYEMTLLAQTEISYNAVADLEKRDFTRMKSVISGT